MRYPVRTREELATSLTNIHIFRLLVRAPAHSSRLTTTFVNVDASINASTIWWGECSTLSTVLQWIACRTHRDYHYLRTCLRCHRLPVTNAAWLTNPAYKSTSPRTRTKEMIVITGTCKGWTIYYGTGGCNCKDFDLCPIDESRK